jgi:hypothetical protein
LTYILAALALFAFPVVPVEATIPTPIEVVADIGESRINSTRHGNEKGRAQTTADKPRCVGHRSG